MTAKFNINLFLTPKHCQTWNRGKADLDCLKHSTEKRSEAIRAQEKRETEEPRVLQVPLAQESRGAVSQVGNPDPVSQWEESGIGPCGSEVTGPL